MRFCHGGGWVISVHIHRQEGDERRDNFGILEPGTPLARFFFLNIKYSLAKARESYKLQFGATPLRLLPVLLACAVHF